MAAEKLSKALDSKLSDSATPLDDIEAAWASFRDTVHSTAHEVVGPATRNHQDWFDENDVQIQELLEEKKPSPQSPPD